MHFFGQLELVVVISGQQSLPSLQLSLFLNISYYLLPRWVCFTRLLQLFIRSLLLYCCSCLKCSRFSLSQSPTHPLIYFQYHSYLYLFSYQIISICSGWKTWCPRYTLVGCVYAVFICFWCYFLAWSSLSQQWTPQRFAYLLSRSQHGVDKPWSLCPEVSWGFWGWNSQILDLKIVWLFWGASCWLHTASILWLLVIEQKKKKKVLQLHPFTL